MAQPIYGSGEPAYGPEASVPEVSQVNSPEQQDDVQQSIEPGEVQSVNTSGQEEIVQVRTVAGRLSNFIQEWINITTDSFILDCIRGYEIPFLTLPPQALSWTKKVKFSVDDEILIHREIDKLLSKGAIVKCKPIEGQFLSPFFLVAKPDGSKRFILNLKTLNKFIKTSHFKLEDLRSAVKLIFKVYFMCTLDLKDAYFLVSVKQSSRKFLRFNWKGQLYEFCCLPFGLCTYSYVFTKLTKPVLQWLRQRVLTSTAYIDDFLCLDESRESYLTNVETTRYILTRLGFIINEEKSRPEPPKCCKYRGFIINSIDMSLSLTADKKRKLTETIQALLQVNHCQIREFAGLLGTLVAACPGVSYGMLYTKILEREKFLALIMNE